MTFYLIFLFLEFWCKLFGPAVLVVFLWCNCVNCRPSHICYKCGSLGLSWGGRTIDMTKQRFTFNSNAIMWSMKSHVCTLIPKKSNPNPFLVKSFKYRTCRINTLFLSRGPGVQVIIPLSLSTKELAVKLHLLSYKWFWKN